MTGTLKERFEAKFVKDPVTECWNWQGCRDKNGYSYIRVNHRTVRAYRVSWELYKGKIPDGMHICHHCDNPSCVNPDHLFLGNNYDNIQDCINKGRNNIGERNARAKLSRGQIAIIRFMLKAAISQSDIAKLFSISQSNVSRINTRNIWNHLKEV